MYQPAETKTYRTGIRLMVPFHQRDKWDRRHWLEACENELKKNEDFALLMDELYKRGDFR